MSSVSVGVQDKFHKMGPFRPVQFWLLRYNVKFKNIQLFHKSQLNHPTTKLICSLHIGIDNILKMIKIYTTDFGITRAYITLFTFIIAANDNHCLLL